MIQRFNDVEAANSGVIFESNFKQIKQLYSMDKEKAGELAISIIEMALTKQCSSDDPWIQLMLANFEESAKRNLKKYQTKVEKTKDVKMEKYQLREIADMWNEGITQAEIGEALGISRQTVNSRINNMIKTEFPELLNRVSSEMSSHVKGNVKMSGHVKPCQDNDNYNYNDNYNNNYNNNYNDKKELVDLVDIEEEPKKDEFIQGDGIIPSLGIDIGQVYPTIWTDSEERRIAYLRKNFDFTEEQIADINEMVEEDNAFTQQENIDLGF